MLPKQNPSASQLFAAGMMDCVKKTIQWEGPTGLYKVWRGYA